MFMLGGCKKVSKVSGEGRDSGGEGEIQGGRGVAEFGGYVNVFFSHFFFTSDSF